MNDVITFPIVKNIKGPIIFLAGPIEGAPLWQKKATEIIQAFKVKITIISPRIENPKKLSKRELIKKIDWETKYLNQAKENGVILFWMAKRITNIASQAYAKSSRFELGEWKERYRISKFGLIVGIEPGFDSELNIRHRLKQDCPNLKIFSTLEKTCKAAVRLK